MPMGFGFGGATGRAAFSRFGDNTGGGSSSAGFSAALGGDSDRVDLNGQQFTAANDFNRLEIINPNEGPGVDRRVDRQLSAIERIADRTDETRNVAEADARAKKRTANDEAQFERASRGMDLSDRQKRSAGQRFGLARALNRARATGDVRRGSTDRAKAALSTGTGFSDALFGQRVSGETELASAFMTEKMSADQREADKKSARIGVAGQVIGSALAFFSSEKLKHDHGAEENLLKKLKKVRVNRWQYKGDDKTHVGPFSEEFNREFGIETKRPDMINVIDALGVTMGAIKELDKKVEANGRL